MTPDGVRRKKATILARGYFSQRRAKTAHGLVRHGIRYEITSVIDETLAGKDAGEVMGIGRKGIPIVAEVGDDAEILIIGVAPSGGAFPPEWRKDILTAIGKGMDIVTGLHDFLADDPEFANKALARGVTIWDVRRTPQDLLVPARGRYHNAYVVLTVGTDAASGKRTTAIEMVRTANRMGHNWGYVATGQSGMMIGCDAGFVIDAIPTIFATGAMEECVRRSEAMGRDVIVVEGQGALSHLAYSPASMGLLIGSRPDAVIMVHDPTLKARQSFPHVPIWSIRKEMDLITRLMPSTGLAGISLNTSNMTDGWEAAVELHKKEFGVPVSDVVRQGADQLVDGVLALMGNWKGKNKNGK